MYTPYVDKIAYILTLGSVLSKANAENAKRQSNWLVKIPDAVILENY